MSLTMDDRDGFIWFDGKLVPWRESRMHVLTHALHYGSAVFEGERIYDGRVFRLVGPQRPPDQLRQPARLRPAVVARGDRRGDARRREGEQSHVRLHPPDRLARLGGAGRVGASARRSISPSRRGPRRAASRCRRATPASTSPWRSTAGPSPETAPGHAKVAGLYVICGIEKDRALKAGFDDALMLDWKGRIAEIDRRQHLPGDRRQAGHADAAQLPRRHHAPRGDGHGEEARLDGRGARRDAGRTGPGERGLPVRHAPPRSCRSARSTSITTRPARWRGP